MRFLIVEDEAVIADVIEEVLVVAGHHVVSICGSLGKALNCAASTSFDAVILDANLRGHDTSSVAERLELRRTPFLVISGYDRTELQPALARAPFLRKPFQPSELLSAIANLGTV